MGKMVGVLPVLACVLLGQFKTAGVLGRRLGGHICDTSGWLFQSYKTDSSKMDLIERCTFIPFIVTAPRLLANIFVLSLYLHSLTSVIY